MDLTNGWKFFSSGDNGRGWGSRYPSWGILTPTQDCILKIFTKEFVLPVKVIKIFLATSQVSKRFFSEVQEQLTPQSMV